MFSSALLFILEEFEKDWFSFLFKHVKEFTREAIWIWARLYPTNLISVFVIDLPRFSVFFFESVLTIFVFLGLYPFALDCLRVGTQLFAVLPYLALISVSLLAMFALHS